MSKKVNESKAATTATNPNPRYFSIEELKEQFEKYSNVSIRKLATASGVTYGILLKASRAPEPGVAYDPEAINYGAINNEFIKRKIDITTLDWEEMNQGNSKATLIKDHSEFTVGMKVYLRKNLTTPYEIIYKTETHIVILLEGTTEPNSWAISTFMFNGPSLEPRAVTNEEPEVVTEA